jgi:hypothetical protein
VNARLFGTLVLAAGVVLVAGAGGLHGGKAVGRALATVAALLGIALGALLFVAQAVNDEPDRRLVLWAGIIVLSVAAFIGIRARTPEEERRQGVWSQLPIVKSAISLGVLISAAQFWYTSIYVPTTAPASLTLEPKIEEVTPRGDQLAVKGSVTIRNTSGTRVNVLASSLDLSGDRLAEGPASKGAPVRAFRKAISDADQGVEVGSVGADRYVGSNGLTEVAHRRLVEDGTYLESGEVLTVPIFTRIPKRVHFSEELGRTPKETSFDSLALDAWVAMARGKVLAIETKRTHYHPTKNGLIALTAVPEAGWLLRLTRGDRFVRTEYSNAPEGDFPNVSFAPDRKRHPPSDFNERLRRFYGVAESSSRAVKSLPGD